MSLIVWDQFNGRSMRPLTGKDFSFILDPVGNTFIHGRPEMDHVYELTGKYKNIENEQLAPHMKICPLCGNMNADENINCHICGYDFSSCEIKSGVKRKLPAMVDGKLVMLDDFQLDERRESIQNKLEKQKIEKRKIEKNKSELIELSQKDKINILKNGLEKKSGMFADAVNRYL